MVGQTADLLADLLARMLAALLAAPSVSLWAVQSAGQKAVQLVAPMERMSADWKAGLKAGLLGL